jgi:hypothetical protein
VEGIVPRSFLCVPIALALVASGAAAAPEWTSLRDVDTVEVLTTDEDGEPRATTVWLVVVDGQGYVRTGGSSWGDNVVRSPELELRVGADTHPMRVEFVEDDALRQRVSDAFGAKYGFSDRMVSWIRGSRPKIMQLHPRQ